MVGTRSVSDHRSSHRRPCLTSHPPVCIQVGTLRQIALGVYYLHCCRPCVLHLDLKSANVLLDRHGVAKVTDCAVLSAVT